MRTYVFWLCIAVFVNIVVGCGKKEDRVYTAEAVNLSTLAPAPTPALPVTVSAPVVKPTVPEKEPAAKVVKRSRYSSEYDKHFEKYANHYLPLWDWRWLKAQCFQESKLKYDAVSPVGAQGLCQFMPGTWKEMERNAGVAGMSPFNPEANIRAASYYDATLYRQWSSKRAEQDKKNLVFASYNAGLGNLLRSQNVCGGAIPYAEIVACLPKVTGEYSRETLTYVTRINQWYGEIAILQ